jgi:mRNA-degrading endonuclease toxin of MazEF toxin-antitoxin module
VIRGEIWRYAPVIHREGATNLRLVISAAAINENPDFVVVLTLQIVNTDPGGLLAVCTEPYGWVSALAIEATLKRRLTERVGAVDQTTMDQVATALRAAQDL